MNNDTRRLVVLATTGLARQGPSAQRRTTYRLAEHCGYRVAEADDPRIAHLACWFGPHNDRTKRNTADGRTFVDGVDASNGSDDSPK